MTNWLRRLFFASLVISASTARAQIDAERRQLVQFGYNQPLEGRGPFAAYAFYYHNEPGFIRTNWVLRAAVAPTYLDSELGFRGLISPKTDLAVGIAGGGFADSYSEVRDGHLLRNESFTGHGAEINLSIYHIFNPMTEDRQPESLSETPLQAVLRSAARYSAYVRDRRTAPDFTTPEDKVAYHIRSGLRWGGREPMVAPAAAVELSVWYEGQFRTDAQEYGFEGDRGIRGQTHLLWARALVAYTFHNRQRFEIAVTAGDSLRTDRFSAYRLGGALPLAAEFPLMLPGYYFQEISARRFALLSANYSVPIVSGWEFIGFGSTAVVDFLPGAELDGDWHSGVGGGVGWTSPEGAWHVVAGYSYGVNAKRHGTHGAHSIGLILQWDIQRGGLSPPEVRRGLRVTNPASWRGFDRLFGR